MLQVYKILNDGRNMYPDKFLELNIRAGRKNSLKLFKRRTDRDIYKYSFTSRVVNQPSLDLNSSIQLVNDLVSSKLDYCNSLFYGLPDTSIKRLQRVQNSLARVIFFLLLKDLTISLPPLQTSLTFNSYENKI